jgi:hypothetical protein
MSGGAVVLGLLALLATVGLFGPVIAGVYLTVRLNGRSPGTGSGSSLGSLGVVGLVVLAVIAIPVVIGVVGLLGLSIASSDRSASTVPVPTDVTLSVSDAPASPAVPSTSADPSTSPTR